MPAVITVLRTLPSGVTSKTFKGRTVASAVRTNFGEKAAYEGKVLDRYEAFDGESSVVVLNGKGETVAVVVSAREWEPRPEPKSRARRWEEAVSAMQDAVSEAQEIWRDKEEADGHREGLEEGEEFQEEDFEDDESLQERLDTAQSNFNDAVSEIESLKEEYAEWRSNLPEGLEDSPTAEKLDEVENLEVSEVEWNIEDNDPSQAEDMISELESADLPLGWGRD
jgi:hypothetical protein